MSKRRNDPPDSLKQFAAEQRQAAANVPSPVDELPVEVGVLQNLVRQEQAKRRKAEAFHEVLITAAQDILRPLRLPTLVKPMKLKLGKRVAESQFLHLSDLQIGKVTETYNLEQFEREMTDTFETTLEIAEIMRSHHEIDELVVALNGDLVEGEDIFPGQPWVSQVDVLRQATTGAQILASKIGAIAANYPSVRVYVTRGNHGRSGRNWSESSNWDLVLGEFVKLLLADSTNISCHVEPSWYCTYLVKGQRIIQTHGDRIRSGGDTPFTAILKRSTNWIASLPQSYNVLIIGHFHNYAEFMWHKRSIFVNGSPESSNDYAASYMGMASRPLQGMFFVHPTIGVTYRAPVYLGRNLNITSEPLKDLAE